ncbi:MAG: lactonase family protein [Alphaproteobacteria bacterium]|nr:MAG: lactonase family protein [Alphaproteobacteria bacterium]
MRCDRSVCRRGCSGKYAWSQHVTAKSFFYASVGPELSLFEVDVGAAALQKRATVILPANVQYAWPHPSMRYLYVVSSDGGPGLSGTTHRANAFRIDSRSGALEPHGEPQPLPSRPIHTSVDASGEYLLTAYNDPSNVTVHHINGDGAIGEPVRQPGKLDTGIYGHQIRTTPGNRAAILVTRGNNAAGGKPEDPGALKVFTFDHGTLTNLASIAPGTGFGFGPRHLDFHPTQPWAYVSIERQNKLYAYKLQPEGALERDPMFVKDTLANPAAVKPGQGAGAIHVHPSGRFVYLTNRNQDEVAFEGQKVFNGGENNVAVFAIDAKTGEPSLIQTSEGFGIQLRTFGIDASGRLLAAANIKPLLVREGSSIKTLSAGIMVYRIAEDGKLGFVRKYDVDTRKGQQFWSGMVALA